ncbi:hypothetical protein F4781DRAFT_412435 [Annulohypoxylon bovei var. microspora]|nr:hypothetical protein F4781DRAFT_412435 [Annulohypoxylon bovei var. microspora]
MIVEPHQLDHHQIQRPTPFSCAECCNTFSNKSQLEKHAKSSQHCAITCSCGESFTRLQSLVRHQGLFRDNVPLFPCTFCKRHRGKHGFLRQDHLVQHLEGYHKLDSAEIRKAYPRMELLENSTERCLDPECEFYMPEEYESLPWIERCKIHPFKRRCQFIRHLKEAHKMTPFPCPVIKCKRVGAKGYTTMTGLEKHLVSEHPATPENLAGLGERWDWDRICDHCGEKIPHLERFNLHCQFLHQT